MVLPNFQTLSSYQIPTNFAVSKLYLLECHAMWLNAHGRADICRMNKQVLVNDVLANKPTPALFGFT